MFIFTTLKSTPLVLLVCAFSLTAIRSLYSQSFLSVYQKGNGELVTDLTIGGNVSEEDYLLSGPGKIAVDAKGNIFVLDSRENDIKKL